MSSIFPQGGGWGGGEERKVMKHTSVCSEVDPGRWKRMETETVEGWVEGIGRSCVPWNSAVKEAIKVIIIMEAYAWQYKANGRGCDDDQDDDADNDDNNNDDDDDDCCCCCYDGEYGYDDKC